jgi:hypothetical protein
MIAEIKGLPNNVAAFRVTGHVTKKNYDDVILPVVANVKSHHPHFNFLMVIETDIKNYTIGAWADDFLMSLINITRFHRMALVSESGFVDWLTYVVNAFAPGEYKTFHLKEEQEAVKWVTSG